MGGRALPIDAGKSKEISASLTNDLPRAIDGPVKTHLFLLSAALCLHGTSTAQDGAPPAVEAPPVEAPAVEGIAEFPAQILASAVTAVGALGKEVVLGNYQVAIQRMNPMWKERTAKRMGGMEQLEMQLDGVAKQMVQQGISMMDFRPDGNPRGFEVWPGKKIDVVNGQEVESLIYTKWMVLVPTVTRFRINRENEKALIIDSIGYQVAISDKDKLDWTFIDGSGLNLNDLRSLFANLPQDLQLPIVEKREAP
jgi:hypothetical protein